MYTEEVGEGPCAEGFDKGNVSVDVEDVSEPPHAKILAEASCCTHQRYWRRYIVDVYVGDVKEAPLAIGVEG